MKPIVLTRHAQTKMDERRILKSWVESIVQRPQWIEADPLDPDLERRFGSVAEFGERILRVVCVETDSTIRIVTATFDRGARRKP